MKKKKDLYRKLRIWDFTLMLYDTGRISGNAKIVNKVHGSTVFGLEQNVFPFLYIKSRKIKENQ